MYILSEDNLKELLAAFTPDAPCINGVSIIDLIITMSANNTAPIAAPVIEPVVEPIVEPIIAEEPVTDATA